MNRLIIRLFIQFHYLLEGVDLAIPVAEVWHFGSVVAEGVGRGYSGEAGMATREGARVAATTCGK